MAGHKATPYDLEEITPGHFIVHNENAYSVLRGEGERRGKLFVLTTWRREGLLARIAARQYKVLTLEGRLAALPELPVPYLPGAVGIRSIASTERYSRFDGWKRRWQPLDAFPYQGGSAVELRAEQIVRRRKGRAAPEYGRAVAERQGQIGMQPLDEASALLAGFSQAVALGTPPLAVKRVGDDLIVPIVPLPQSYREFLRRVADEIADGWRIGEQGLPFAERAFERLGIELAIAG